MNINPEDYNYKALAVGAHVKYPHLHCSKSLAMSVSVKPEGCLFYCHKCQSTKFVPFEGQSYRDRKKREAEFAAYKAEEAREGYDLPADFTHSIDAPGLAWLGLGGWTPDLIEKHGVGWSPSMARVIIPVLPDGYIARAVFSDQQPKYLEMAPKHAYWQSEPHGSDVVLVEDVLSAARVGRFVPAVAILGTDTKKFQILPDGGHLVTWFDGDKAGRKATIAIRSIVQWREDITLTEILTDDDPKNHSDADIEEILRFKGVL